MGGYLEMIYVIRGEVEWVHFDFYHYSYIS